MNKSQSKFKVGDRVRISKKYRTSYNSITNVGTVTKVNFEGDRNKYTVQWDDKAFKQRYYSYELDKAEQTAAAINAAKPKKTLPIVMVQFRKQDQQKQKPIQQVIYKFKVGDRVYVKTDTIEHVKAAGFDENEVSRLSLRQVIEKAGCEHGRTIYKLRGIDSMHFHENELCFKFEDATRRNSLQYKSEAKFPLGTKVVLKKDVADKYVAINIAQKEDEIRGPHEVVSVNFPPDEKAEYYIAGFGPHRFHEDDLEIYPEKRIEADAKRLECARKNAWVGICNVYLFQFCKRHGYQYDPDAWVSSDPGTTAEVCDMFVSMDDIRYDVDNKVDPELFSEWYWKSLEIHELTGGKVSYMNYPSFCKGAPDEFTPERMEKLRASKKRMDEAQKDFEETVRQYVEQSGHEKRKKLF